MISHNLSNPGPNFSKAPATRPLDDTRSLLGFFWFQFVAESQGGGFSSYQLWRRALAIAYIILSNIYMKFKDKFSLKKNDGQYKTYSRNTTYSIWNFPIYSHLPQFTANWSRINLNTESTFQTLCILPEWFSVALKVMLRTIRKLPTPINCSSTVVKTFLCCVFWWHFIRRIQTLLSFLDIDEYFTRARIKQM